VGSLVGDTYSYEWREPSVDESQTILVATIRGVRISVLSVQDEVITDDSTPYQVIELLDAERLSLMIIVSSAYLRFIEDEVDDPIQAALTRGAFLGHICTEAASNLLDYDWEDEE